MPVPHATHPTPDALAAFAVGKLPDADARAVASHLVACPDCRRAAEETHGADSFVARLRAAGAPGSSADTQLPGPRQASPAAALNLPPELAGHPRYRILRELGRGGMGVVYHAEQTLMERQVAIKVISKALLDQPGALERFEREVQSAAKLSHPNIVIAYDAERAGELHMLVMEFVEGQSLDHVLRRKGPLPVLHACHYVRQAALGLQHAHERGMVHRDIKPQNLMLTPKGQVKILDFGLAKLVSESNSSAGLTAANSYMGTPDYSAPEQATDARTADIRADIYSLGCTLYCLLAGHPPFHEETAVQTILAHLEKEPAPLSQCRPDVPAALGAVVARMLAKDPTRRFQKPVEVAQALLPYVKPGQQVAAPPAAAPSQGVAAPGRGTMAAGEASRIPLAAKGPMARSAVNPEPGATLDAFPVEGHADTTLNATGAKLRAPAPAGLWRKRPVVIGGVACAALLLIALGGILLLVNVVVPFGRGTPSRKEVAGPPPQPAGEDVVITKEGNVQRVRTPQYEAVIGEDGNITNLKIGGVEFFKSGVPYTYGNQTSRGAFLYGVAGRNVLRMPVLDSAANVVSARGDTASVRHVFHASTMSWSATNLCDTEECLFIVFDKNVKAVTDGKGAWAGVPVRVPANAPANFRVAHDWPTTTWFAGSARLTLAGGTRIWGPWPNHADNYQIWQLNLPPHEMREVAVSVGEATPEELTRVAALTGTAASGRP
jgi:hypothetical protein